MCLLTNNLKQSIILCIFKSEQQQNDSNKEREHLPANEKNELPANTPQPPLENEQAGSSETTPVILQTEPPMEVHAHTHTPRKKWTHYFWEFLMLFLAVFAGFLAENQREHYIEHKREKQFISTMVEDLKSDTAQLTETIAYKKSKELMLDSLIMYLSRAQYQKYGSDIYYYARNVTRPQYFSPNDRTIQQLKNSGALRLIRKLSISDSIMYYDQQLRYLSTLNEDERSIRDNFRDLVGSVFDGKVFYSQVDSVDFANYNRPNGNPSLILQDAISINKVISAAQYLKTVNRGVRARQEKIKYTAVQLLSFLQKEYHLE